MLRIDLTALDTWDLRRKLFVFCGLCSLVAACGYALLIANLPRRLSDQHEKYTQEATLLASQQREIQRQKPLPKLDPLQVIANTSPPLNALKHCNVTDFKWQQPHPAESQGKLIRSFTLSLQYSQAICIVQALAKRPGLGYLQKLQLSNLANQDALLMQLDFTTREL